MTGLSRSVHARPTPLRCRPRSSGRLATVLPDAIARANGDLCALELDPPLPTRTAALLTRKGAYRSVAARAFVERTLAHGDAPARGR
ncbi:hypothetical protein WK05_01815 [Burkholderia ubonensis]|nr:hypothetical protein WJ74_12030 [Burkholderia ubonensis]KVO15438.1 hypothetical protein WJ72_13260 [Burkholderia ubonensis]KVQ67477.1 hypothetical protein WK05_01815 [Burkholderia ubonensis]KVU01203.1 hypothetical protein WK60_33435 [Burkholderia ubonensis]KVU39286.1 hypothetical protein WK69_27875 [Burkholderia ubonensis]